MSTLHDRCIAGPMGSMTGASTGGEARTLAAIVHGIDAEEVDSFVLVTVTHCSVCGRHTMLLEKDMSNDMAKNVLGSAIGAIIMNDLDML